MTLRMKLIGGFSAVLAAFLAVGLFNLQQVGQIRAQLAFQNEKVELKQMALELKETVQELNVIASGLEISKKVEYIAIYNEKRAQFDQRVKRIGDTASTPDEIQWRSKLISLTVDYANTFDVAARLVQDNKLPPADMDKNMEYLYNESQKLKDEIFTYVDRFYVVYSKEAQAAVASSQGMLNRTAAVMLGAFALVFAAAVGIALLLIRSFLRPIRALQQAAGRIAEGDLRQEIGSLSKDELGELSRSFDHMIRQVRNMLANSQAIASALSGHARTFHGFADTTAAANGEIVRAIQEIAEGAGGQATHSEASAVVLSELEREMDRIAAETSEMREASEAARRHTESGAGAMHALQQASGQSEAVFGSAFAAMEALAAGSREIGRIVAAITDISAQTNVLALNASIEAARAGQYGKGFTVIAGEVRQLSARTNESAKMVAPLIQSLQSRIAELQASLQSARGMMGVQSGRMDETKTAFEAIRRSTEELNGHILLIHDKIALAKQQTGALAESAQFVAAVAQQTAAGVQEVTSSSLLQDASIRRIVSEADDIKALSESLFREINQFRIDEPKPPTGPETAADVPAEAKAVGETSAAAEPARIKRPAASAPGAEPAAAEGSSGADAPEPGSDAEAKGAKEAEEAEEKRLVTV